jgi:hypothetical protein
MVHFLLRQENVLVSETSRKIQNFLLNRRRLVTTSSGVKKLKGKVTPLKARFGPEGG